MMNTKYAPVVAFAYNRADKIQHCLESLMKNQECNETDLIIFCDGVKDGASEEDIRRVEAVRKYLDEFCNNENPFHSVRLVKFERNRGLANSILNGVTEIMKEYGRAIVIEDDLVFSSRFLEYMNKALLYYWNNENVGAISAYTYPLRGLKEYSKDVYTLRKGDCWGWASWENRWNNARWADVDFREYFGDRKLRRLLESTENEWDLLMLLQYQNKVSSWAIRWVLYLLKSNLWTVYPAISLVTNDGMDGSGTHSGQDVHFFSELKPFEGEYKFTEVEENRLLAREAAVFPRQGLIKYFLHRAYVKLFDLLRHVHLSE